MFKLNHTILVALLAVVASGFMAAGASAAGSSGAVVFSEVGTESFKGGDGEVVQRLNGGLYSARERNRNRLTEDPADSQPAFSPDGRRIAFIRHGDIWVMRADGTAQRVVTSGAEIDSRPLFAPNGRYLLFERRAMPDAPRDLYTVRVGGGEPRPLASSPADEHEAAFAPNGRVIAFVRGIAKGDGGAGEDVLTVRPSGAAKRRLTRTSQLDEFSPRFFARGIVFNRGLHGSGPDAYADVFAMRVNGRAISPLVRGAGSAYVQDIARNGRLLLFRRGPALWTKPIGLRRRASRPARKLMELGDAAAVNAVFSADGRHVAAFVAGPASASLSAIDVATRRVVRLAWSYQSDPETGIGPVIAWQPARKRR